MNKILGKLNLEKGQMIPIVVLLLIVILGMTALIVDGGSVMSNRRSAQAAADAGALAGAKSICSGKSDAKAVAEHFAIVNNDASSATATVSGFKVRVDATVENPSFFAKIFGEDTLTASAESVAGCYGVRGQSVVPLAFFCHEETIGGQSIDNYDCVMLTLDWETELQPLKSGETVSISGNDYFMSGTNIVDSAGVPPIDHMYIIIDTDKLACVSDGGSIPCDLDGDGKKEVQFGGNRGWLYLTTDGSTLKNYINQGPSTNISINSHKWLSGDPGTQSALYGDMITAGYPGAVVLIPVYNYFCPGDPRTDTGCMTGAHASPWPAEPDSGDDFSDMRNTKDNYHILAFAPFYVSCVAKNDGNCPGFKQAQKLLEAQGHDLKKDSVIEGFFLSGFPVLPDVSEGCTINMGSCIVSLSE